MSPSENGNNAPEEIISNQIFLIRGKKVMVDKYLAQLYDIETNLQIGSYGGRGDVEGDIIFIILRKQAQ